MRSSKSENANFNYIVTNIAGAGVNAEEFEEDLAGCECDEGQCSSAKICSCLKLSGGESHYDEQGRLLSSIISTKPIFECSVNCACYSGSNIKADSCRNRVVQFGENEKIEVFNTEIETVGYGMRATNLICRGEFVAEYVGEVISREEAAHRFLKQRESESAEWRHNYIFTLNEFFAGKFHRTYIDARNHANMARFINHSCEPNLYPQIVRVGCLTPRLALFAMRDIQKGEELCYNYGFTSLTSTLTKADVTKSANESFGAQNFEGMNFTAKNCLCGAPSCLGVLPSFTGDNL